MHIGDYVQNLSSAIDAGYIQNLYDLINTRQVLQDPANKDNCTPAFEVAARWTSSAIRTAK